MRRHERLSIHFSAEVTPHVSTHRERREVFSFFPGSLLPQNSMTAWHWFMATRIGCSAGTQF